MNDHAIINMMEQDLLNKCGMFNIRIYQCDDLENCSIKYTLLDTVTSNQEIIIIYSEELIGLDEIHKVMMIYNKIMEAANLLIADRNK